MMYLEPQSLQPCTSVLFSTHHFHKTSPYTLSLKAMGQLQIHVGVPVTNFGLEGVAKVSRD